jgi:tetratricopeptide (TPR) repeat protein
MRILIFCTFLIVACSKDSTPTEIENSPIYMELEQYATRYDSGDTSAIVQLTNQMQSCSGKKECQNLAYSVFVLADKYSNSEEIDLSNELLYAGKFAAEKSGDERTLSHYIVEFAFNYLKKKNNDSLNYYLGLAEKIPQANLSDLSRTQLFNVKAILADEQGKYLEAIEYYRKAYEIEKNSGTINEAAITENIGLLYNSLKNHNRAISYFQIALPVYEAQYDTGRLIRIFSNLGIAYMRIDSLDIAAEFHLKGLQLSEPNSFSKARGLANYGNVLRRKAQYEEAIMVFDSSIAICQNLDIPFGIFVNKINLAHTLMELGKSKEAILMLNEIMFSPFMSNKEFSLEIWDILRQSYEKLGDISKAFLYQKKYLDLKDELSKQGDERLVLEWEENLVRQQKDQDLAKVNLELINSQQQQKFLIFGSIVFLLIGLSIGRSIYLNKQKEVFKAQLLLEETENLRLQLEVKERELTSQSVHLQALGGFAEDISNKLYVLKDKLGKDQSDELNRIIRDFENGIPEELWEDFRVRFENVNKDFYHKLFEICPDLSPVEIKIASFLRLNLSSKEISRLTNRSSGTITNTRSSLRKKLNLDEEDNLVAFLMSL